MKKIFILLIPILTALWGCDENDQMVWKGQSGIYYPDYITDSDSLLYSLRISGGDEDTVWIKVKLQGALLDEPKSFCVTVGDNTTAEEGIHYVKLPENYTFPANQAVCKFPVVIMNKNKDLDQKTVTLELQLQNSKDFSIAIPEQRSMRLIFTNRLIKPSYWTKDWLFYFSEYSQAKHLKCIEIMGHDFPATEEELDGYGDCFKMTYWQRVGHQVCHYYQTHEEYDENGKRIEPWEVF